MKPEHLQDALNDINEEYIADAHGCDALPDQSKATAKKTGASRAKRLKFRLAAVAAYLFISLGVLSVFRLLPGGADTAQGVTIPKAALPEPSHTVDMVGLICHNGKVYYQSGSYSSDHKEDVFRLVDTYLGEAVSDVDEWTVKNDGWITELAATTWGSVYTLKDYDEDFRICTANEWQHPEEGHIRYYLTYYECLNGITLTKGSDLLEERLHLSETLPDTTVPEITELVSALNDAWFVYVAPNTTPYNVYLGDPTGDFRRKKDYSKRLVITPEDQVPIYFTVYKNGYVCYNSHDLRNNYFMVVAPAKVEFIFE